MHDEWIVFNINMWGHDFGTFLGGAIAILKSYSGKYRSGVGKGEPLGWIQPTACFVSKVVPGHRATPICLCNRYGYFPTTTAELSNCDRD